MITSVVVGVLLCYGGVLGVVAALQRRLIFRPDKRNPDPWLSWLAGSPIVVRTPDGLVLHSWLAEPNVDRPLVLYLHGNGGHIGYRAAQAAQFCRLGWGVLLLGYRGYGGNAGYPSERGMLADANAALDLLLARGVSPTRIVLWGESLGSGLAVKLAGRVPVGAVVLEAPYTSLVQLIQQRFPLIPAWLLLRDRFDCLSGIAAVRSPLFVLAGSHDTLIPLALSRAVFMAGNEPKRMMVIPNGEHNTLKTPAAIADIIDFVGRHLAAP